MSLIRNSTGSAHELARVVLVAHRHRSRALLGRDAEGDQVNSCAICGATEGVYEYGPSIYVCESGDCARRVQREERDACEMEREEAHRDLDVRMGWDHF